MSRPTDGVGADGVRLRVLGPVRAVVDSTPAELGGPQQRLVLALLVAGDGPVSTDRLIDDVWHGRTPATARKTLQGYVHHVRRALGDVIVTEGAGYRLDLEQAMVDARDFATLAARGRADLADDPARAADTLADALAMWSGRPYEDVDHAPALEAEITRLNELRLAALEDRIEADLSLAATPALVGELQSLAREFPLRERLHGLLVLALYRAGRQADAVRAHDRIRRDLAEELGLDPSPALMDLQERILRQDPGLLVSGEDDRRGPHGLHGYELREVAGSGPLGTVHRAYQSTLGRQVALKVLRAEVADDPAVVEHFAESARRIATLDHPRIVPLHDAWREPGAAHLVMPWFDAGSLHDRLIAGSLPVDRALEVLEQVGGALDHAHRRGLAHGRVKPTNVLLDGDGGAWLSDFALAGASRIVGSRDQTWLAPEIVAGRPAVVPATDVYGMAAVARALLAGPPGDDRDGDDVRPPGDRSDPQLHDEVDATLAAGLDPDPVRRPAKVSDFLRRLRRSLGHDVTPAAVAGPRPVRSDLRNPFKGLRAFQEVDADDFFGRDALVDRIVARLVDHRFVAVVGPSGVGKSSVVKAGVLPRLRTDHPDHAPPLLVAELFPGAHPFEELEAALLRVAVHRPTGMAEDLAADDRGLLRVAKQVLPDDDATLVLVIDQFEEVFSLVTDESVRRRFLDGLLTAVTDARSPIRVVVTLRADFYDRPLQYRGVAEVVEQGLVTVTPPSAEELGATIAGPARLVGLELEPGLVAEVVADVVDQPGGLPLLQYAMTELVDERDSDRLTISAYRDRGGVLGALGRRAEQLWDDLGPRGRDAARQAFLRMVTVDESGDDMRRRVRHSELASLRVARSDLSRVLTVFGTHRLLSFDRDPITRGPTVEVAHEALLREWPRLRGWIEAQREDLVLARRLSTELREWVASDRDPSYLLRGDRLARFETWADQTDLTLTRPERDFLVASRELRDREVASEERTNRRLRRLLAVVSVLALVAGVAGVAAWLQAGRAADQAEAAERSRADAETRRLALQAPQLMNSERQVALLLAAEAMRRDAGPTSVGALQSVLVGLGGFLGETTVASPYSQVLFGRGDVLLGQAGASIDVLPAATAEPRLSIPAVAPEVMAISQDRSVLAVVDDRGVNLYDPTDGTHLAEVDDHPQGAAISAAFDAGTERLAVGELGGDVWVYDLATGEGLEITAHPEQSHAGIAVPVHQPNLAKFGVRTLAFDADGDRLVTGGLVFARTWDVATGDQLDEVEMSRLLPDGQRFPAPVDAVAFDGDDRIVLASSWNVAWSDVGSGALDLVTELEFPDRANTQGGNLEAVAVELAAGMAVLGEWGGEITTLDLANGSVQRLDAQVSGIPLVAVSADGRTLAFAGREDVVRWSLDGRSLIATAIPSDGQSAADLSADGRWLALSAADRRPPRLWELSPIDTRPGLPPTARPVTLPDDPPVHYAIPGAEDWLLTVDLDGPRLHVRPLDDLDAAWAVPGGATVQNPTFSRDGRWLAWATNDPNEPPLVQVLDLESRQPVTTPLDGLTGKDNYGVPSLAFSPDRRFLLGSGTRGEALLWNTRDWSSRWVADGGGAIMFANFGPDGLLAAQRRDGDVIVYDGQTFETRGAPLLGQPDGLTTASTGPWFTTDGNWLLTTADGSGRLWDLQNRQLVGQPIPTDTGTTPDASEDARRLVTFHGGQALVWNLDLGRWPELACTAAGRNLTLEEWDQFGPRDSAYRRTCPQWPRPHDATTGTDDAAPTTTPPPDARSERP